MHLVGSVTTSSTFLIGAGEDASTSARPSAVILTPRIPAKLTQVPASLTHPGRSSCRSPIWTGIFGGLGSSGSLLGPA